jgi:hypothetical protein
MADSARVAALRASLLRELEAACPAASAPPPARLRWLHRELENYLDRWLAFAALDSIPLKSLLNDDLFAMVLVATETCDREFARGPDLAGKEAWAVFTALLSRLRATKDRTHISGLRPGLDRVGAAIA